MLPNLHPMNCRAPTRRFAFLPLACAASDGAGLEEEHPAFYNLHRATVGGRGFVAQL